jgi:response regulator of citrate/malate metabolism
LLFLLAIPALSLEHARRQLEAIGGHGFDAIAIDAYLAEEDGFQFIRTVRDRLIRFTVRISLDNISLN